MLSRTEAAYLAGIIDGEGTITLTKINRSENRRPVISIASTDKELLIYIQQLTGGYISSKKNYHPSFHKNSFSLIIKNKEDIFYLLKSIIPYLRIPQKIKRANLILHKYNIVTRRNGKYTPDALISKRQFEHDFFSS
ncbi:LAGLIDADG family homing endonuclease [Alkalihalobacillus sp. MEB130]|uniref:LAGLIDADG family homing endonuclease n=1 Tax=Alkalihalobacillus sp. MEB130 TaxID=2976704 RepID=UPI0028DF3786|nr:LAGLIDADG family homing endonuclease [Alkalihalobacillus sp. MEB130]MDT8858703.1 LAGLIDADG family homing endonuclease [Alkalihalobacillus sp. MEB130]